MNRLFEEIADALNEAFAFVIKVIAVVVAIVLFGIFSIAVCLILDWLFNH